MKLFSGDLNSDPCQIKLLIKDWQCIKWHSPKILNFLKILLISALRVIVNRQFLESFDTTFIGNINSWQTN